MNTRSLYAILGVIALLIIGLIVYNQSRDNSEVASQNGNANINASPTNTSIPTNVNVNNSNSATNNNTNGQFSDESDLDNGKVYEVVFNGTAFAPNNLTINAGDTIVFKNSSSKNFWPASGPHPQHTNYPEFDPKKAVAAGANFEFKFTKVGEWPFHDHLTPTAFGKIIVK